MSRTPSIALWVCSATGTSLLDCSEFFMPAMIAPGPTDRIRFGRNRTGKYNSLCVGRAAPHRGEFVGVDWQVGRRLRLVQEAPSTFASAHQHGPPAVTPSLHVRFNPDQRPGDE